MSAPRDIYSRREKEWCGFSTENQREAKGFTATSPPEGAAAFLEIMPRGLTRLWVPSTFQSPVPEGDGNAGQEWLRYIKVGRSNFGRAAVSRHPNEKGGAAAPPYDD